MALPTPARQDLLSALESTVLELDHAYLGVGDFIKTCIAAFSNAKYTLSQLSHFDFNPKFNTRVMNIPRAREGINELWNEIRHGLIDKFKEIEDAVQALRNNFLHGGSLHEPGEPGLAAAVDKLQDVHAFLLQLGDLVTKVVDMTIIINDIKHRIETLDDLFLSQGTTKKVVDEHYRKRQRST
jgi:hypothetical protein